MAANSSEPKTFDTVTILGIALAIGIMVFGQMHMSKRKAEADALAEKERAAQIDRMRVEEIRRKREAQDKADKNPVEKAEPGTPTVTKAPPAPEIVTSVKTDFLELEFCSRGAALKHAHLPGIDEDAYKKDHKGLDILAEILPGRRAFGIPNIGIGKVGSSVSEQLIIDDKSPDCLDEVVWTLKDPGAFDASGNRTLAYELTIYGPPVSAKEKPPEYALTKTFTISKSAHFIRCDLKMENRSPQDVEYWYWIYGPQGILLDGPPENPKGAAGSRVSVQAAIAARAAEGDALSTAEPEVLQIDPNAAKEPKDDARSLARPESIWGAVKNRFFMAMFVSNQPRQLLKIEAFPIINENGFPNDKRYSEPNIALKGLRKTVVVHQSAAQNDAYSLYLGPSEDASIEAVELAMKNPTPYYMKESIKFYDLWNWNWPRVDWLARQMMWLFKGLYKIFGSFGVAVALMTILIKLCLHPLQRKMMISMSKMQKLQPDLNKIKDKYKNATSTEAKMKMTQEQQDVMRKAGVNPAAGCLPMFIQIPVFTALYAIFNHAFDMRGAEFLWIKDLSQPDRLYTFATTTASWIPSSINLLPILYIGLSFVQTRMQPQTKSDDPQQEMNRKMMMFMPVMISLMFYSMPAGLVLYFAVSACWGMLESWYIKKFLINEKSDPAKPSIHLLVKE